MRRNSARIDWYVDIWSWSLGISLDLRGRFALSLLFLHIYIIW